MIPACATILENNISLDDNEISDIIRISNGSLVSVFANIESSRQNETNFDMFVKLMRNSYSLNFEEINNLTDEFRGLGREHQKQFLKYAMRMIREYFLQSSGNISLNKLTDNEVNKDTKFATVFPKFINTNNVNEIYKELNEAYFHIERNGNARIVFFDVQIKINKLLKK